MPYMSCYTDLVALHTWSPQLEGTPLCQHKQNKSIQPVSVLYLNKWMPTTATLEHSLQVCLHVNTTAATSDYATGQPDAQHYGVLCWVGMKLPQSQFKPEACLAAAVIMVWYMRHAQVSKKITMCACHDPNWQICSCWGMHLQAVAGTKARIAAQPVPSSQSISPVASRRAERVCCNASTQCDRGVHVLQ